MRLTVQVLSAVCSSCSSTRLHRYLLVQHPHVGHLSLVVVVQPSQLLADLLHMVVLPDQLDVVLSHRLQLVFQLSVLAGQTAVQSAEENTTVSAIKDKLTPLSTS